MDPPLSSSIQELIDKNNEAIIINTKNLILENFKKEIDNIIISNTPGIYVKELLTGDQRMVLTSMAEKKGLASFYLYCKDIAYLIITDSKNEEITIDADYLDNFNWATGYDFKNPATFYEEVKLFGLEQIEKYFNDDMVKLGRDGYKRREFILIKYIIQQISLNPIYKEITINKPKLIIQSKPQISLRYNKSKKIYCKSNDKKVYLSFDIKGSIFLAYHQHGVIKEPSWEEFVSNYTTSNLIKNSKCFRLTLFGKLDKYKLNKTLISNTIIPIWETIRLHFGGYFCVIDSDELLIESKNLEKEIETINNINLPNYVRFQAYQLLYTEIPNGEPLPCIIRKFLHPKDKANSFDIKNVAKKDYKVIYNHILKNSIV